MADGLLHTIKVMREEIAAADRRNREDFVHIGEVLLRVLRELDDIKSLLSVCKADGHTRSERHSPKKSRI